MSTSTAAAPPASTGADGPELPSASAATGVESGATAPADRARDGAGVGVAAGVDGAGLVAGFFSAARDLVGDAAGAAAPSPLLSSAAGNTTSEHE